MQSLQSKFLSNYSYLKVFGDKKIKLVTMKNAINSGYENVDKIYIEKCSVNDEKIAENISRARSTIFELAMCNNWDWFVTATIDKTKYDRYNLSAYYKQFSQFLRDQRKKTGNIIKFMFVPEQHKDDAWHLHGFISGLEASNLRLFDKSEKLPTYILDKLKGGQSVYEWVSYRQKFGFCDFEPIRTHEGAARYVSKYMTEDLAKSVKALNAHVYYCSQGLQRAETIKKGFLSADTLESQVTGLYENEHCSVRWFDYDAELLEQIQSKFF